MWVYSDEVRQGPYTLAGIEEARSEVITFLDDDTYLPTKLEKVFKKKKLIYLHHPFLVITEDGKLPGKAP